jgi:dimethylhistidine N-methyltransferase
MHSIASSGVSAFLDRRSLPQDDFAEAVIAGFEGAQKIIPARFLYDEQGSQLFEEITRVAEYYPTRAETEILRRHAADIAQLTSERRVVVEFGSGSSTKTPLLLDQVDAAAYVPIDISEQFLHKSVLHIREKYPFLDVLPRSGDFTQHISLPPRVRGKPALGFFPGSTIGNATPRTAASLLRAFATILGADAYLAIGFDLKKDPRILESAYDDAAGATAAFNLNLLQRMNRELHGNIPISAFEHRAVWREEHGRVEMHLIATREVQFRVAGCFYRMGVGETIHTENSYKYSIPEAQLLARVSGWEPLAVWTDTQALFSFHLWHLAPCRLEP